MQQLVVPLLFLLQLWQVFLALVSFQPCRGEKVTEDVKPLSQVFGEFVVTSFANRLVFPGREVTRLANLIG